MTSLLLCLTTKGPNMFIPQWVKYALSFNLQGGKFAIFCFPNFLLCLLNSTQLYKMFLNAEFISTIQHPELQISFSVIPHMLWPASLWWCFISKSVIFPTFGNNIGCLHSLFKNDFPNLPPTQITSFPSNNGSKEEILPRLDPSKKNCFSCPVICLSHWGFPQI